MPPETALPLKVSSSSTPAKPSPSDIDQTPKPALKSNPSGQKPRTSGASEISSPHELTAFVESLLEQLDTKFDEMSSQILDRMSQMSSRVDALEASIQDIINGDTTPSGTISVPQSPLPGTIGIRKSDSTSSTL